MSTPRIVRTAYHEAGHAAVGLALGMEITGATVKPSGDTAGRCTAEPFDGSMRAAVWAAGGAVAEHFCLESVGEPHTLRF